MRIKRLISIMIFILIIFFVSIYSTKIKPAPQEALKCGNSICELTEDCNNCATDCACPSGQYCASNGVCRSYVCGDGICSANEADSCCRDCGCPQNNICNWITQKCLEKLKISDAELKNIANSYMAQNGIAGTVTRIADEYYKEGVVKHVAIDCSQPGSEFPCQIILLINQDGNIVEEMRTT